MIFYILVLEQKDLFQNKVFEEILRERISYNFSKNQVLNFWISIEPKILEKIKIWSTANKKKIDFFFDAKKPKKYVCLISTNKEFLNWLQLRFGLFNKLNNDISKKKNYLGQILFESSYLSRDLIKNQSDKFELI